MVDRDFSQIASLMGDPGRAAMLTALLGDIALPAGELAQIANVAPQTASSHLSRLVAAGLLSAEQQGRHRYFRLSNAEVAVAIESLMAITPARRGAAQQKSQRKDSLAYARTCYNHLAGQLAVEIADAFRQRKLLVARPERTYALTEDGRSWLRDFGIEIPEKQERQSRFARSCLDWTERRHHLAGQLGSELLCRFRQLRWIAPMRDTRAVRVTLEGERKFASTFGLRLPRS